MQCNAVLYPCGSTCLRLTSSISRHWTHRASSTGLGSLSLACVPSGGWVLPSCGFLPLCWAGAIVVSVRTQRWAGFRPRGLPMPLLGCRCSDWLPYPAWAGYHLRGVIGPTVWSFAHRGGVLVSWCCSPCRHSKRSGQYEKGKRKMGHDKVMARFCDAPSPLVFPLLSPPVEQF